MSQLRTSIPRISTEALTLALLGLAAVAWWFTWRMAVDMGDMGDMSGSGGMGDMSGASNGMTMAMPLGTFLVGWALMMTAMMLPAVTPVVRLYQRAATLGRVAPTGWFVGAYLVVWAITGLPAYLLWELVSIPLMDGATWALRLGGASLLLAGVYQLTPLKRACLRHCRSPMSYFMRLRTSLETPTGAVRAGLLHALYCCGCCAALMVVLVVTAAMNLWWTVLIALAVFVERNVRWGPPFATALGVALVALGAAFVLSPSSLTPLI